jgi:hypothetical protein
MTEAEMTQRINQIADELNCAAAHLDAALRIEPGSPLARMVEQCARAAAMMPEPREPTKWDLLESC